MVKATAIKRRLTLLSFQDPSTSKLRRNSGSLHLNSHHLGSWRQTGSEMPGFVEFYRLL